MITKKVEFKHTVIERVEIIDKVICDGCGREIAPAPCYDPYNAEHQYVEVESMHSDWGNDSCDSYTTRQFCFPCAADYMSKFISNEMPNTTYEVTCSTVRLYKDGAGNVVATD